MLAKSLRGTAITSLFCVFLVNCSSSGDDDKVDSGTYADTADTDTDTDTDADTDTDTDTDNQATQVRFHLDVSNDMPESVYVQLYEEDGQPVWITVSRDSERISLTERCEIEDCLKPSGVCGAALPMVRDITGGTYTGTIEFVWDGKVSVIDSEKQCELREPSPDGAYTAEFCWSLKVDLDEGAGDPASEQGAAGHVVEPACVNVPFTYPIDTDVGYEIQGG